MFTLNCRGRLLTVHKPLVMGIINVTPDSFYSGSRQQTESEVLRQAEKMLGDGASILDVGGQSTRPGSEKISAEEEIKRITGPVEAIAKNFPEAFISIDTYYAAVAKEAVAAGASIINDISAGSIDPGIISFAASAGLPYVLMHMPGTPQTMQQYADYTDVTKEVLDFFIRKIKELKDAGMKDIIIDPGFGFGKKAGHNFRLLKELFVFSVLDCPVMLGISRKSMIHKSLKITADESLNGTTVLNTIGLINGVSILRVHDVKEAVEAVRLFDLYRNS